MAGPTLSENWLPTEAEPGRGAESVPPDAERPTLLGAKLPKVTPKGVDPMLLQLGERCRGN